MTQLIKLATGTLDDLRKAGSHIFYLHPPASVMTCTIHVQHDMPKYPRTIDGTHAASTLPASWSFLDHVHGV
jgi:hypothetical protein